MKQNIENLLRQAITTIATDPTASVQSIPIERPKDPSHGDWSSSIALVLAKSLKLTPRQLAEQIIANIPHDDQIEKITLAGPGFINFSLTKNYLNQQLQNLWQSPTSGVTAVTSPQTVVIDYSSPNLAKEMHVGHLRSTIIGDALVRIIAFQGHHVIRQNHIGDWGTQFGMLLAHMHDMQSTSQTFDLSDLESFYLAAKQRFDHEAEFADKARAWVVKLQSHEDVSYNLWKTFIHLSLSHCQELYQRLKVTLKPEDIRAESAYNDDLPKIVHTLQEKGFLNEQDGTKCVFLEQFKGKDDQPLPIIVQKKDGGYLYASTDLAALDYRAKVLKADRILYVVDARQALHFKQIFALAILAELVPAQVKLEHIDFGMILNKAGKPFKSRDGGVTKLVDLLNEAEERAATLIQSKNPQLPIEECQQMAKVIGIGAVKYADLSKNRISDYVFDWDTMLSFEGNTAPYLLYANTRIHSLFHKAQISFETVEGQFDIQTPQELSLGKHLILFPEVIAAVIQKCAPHLLATFLFELAGLFSTFYETCPILTAETASSKNSRLLLAALTSKILEQGLQLLGIETLQRM